MEHTVNEQNKTITVNGYTFDVVEDLAGGWYLQYGRYPVIMDGACEDYTGTFEEVADTFAAIIEEEASKPFPWFVLLDKVAIFEWGSDPQDIDNEEKARSIADVINNATQLVTQVKSGTPEYEWEILCGKLSLEPFEVTEIHTFVNGSAGSFAFL